MQTPGDPTSPASAIDRVLVSTPGLQLVRKFQLLPFDSCQHRPLQICLNVCGCHHAFRTLRLPRKLDLSMATAANLHLDWDTAMQRIVRHTGRGNVDAAHVAWSQTAETSLGASSPGFRGRGGHAHVVLRPLLPVSLPSCDLWEATTFKTRRLAKLHRQLKEYRVKLSKGLQSTSGSQSLLQAIQARWSSLCLPPLPQPLDALDFAAVESLVSRAANLLQAEVRACKVARLKAWKTAMTTSTKARYRWLRDGTRLHHSRCIRSDAGELLTDPEGQHAALLQAWTTGYHRHRRLTEGDAPFLAEYASDLETLRASACECALPALTGEMLQEQLRRMAPSSPGVDGWWPIELKALGLDALNALAALLRGCESTGALPAAWRCAVTTLLTKSPRNDFRTSTAMVIEDPLAQRPITVLSATYRLWSSVRFHHMATWISSWAPKCLLDDVHAASWKVSLALSQLRGNGEGFAVLLLDKEKFFDLQRPTLCTAILRSMGCDLGVLRVLCSLYRSLRRAHRFNRALSDWFETSNGVIQGDSLSLYLVLATQAVLVTRLSNVAPEMCLSIYVDDTTAWCAMRDAWTAFASELSRHDALSGSSTSIRKTTAYQTFDPPVTWLHQFATASDEVKLLGAGLALDGLATTIRDGRAEVAARRAAKGRHLPMAPVLKAEALAASCSMYGYAAVQGPTSQHTTATLRAAILQALAPKSRDSRWREKHLFWTLVHPGHRLEPDLIDTFCAFSSLHLFLHKPHHRPLVGESVDSRARSCCAIWPMCQTASTA